MCERICVGACFWGNAFVLGVAWVALGSSVYHWVYLIAMSSGEEFSAKIFRVRSRWRSPCVVCAQKYGAGRTVALTDLVKSVCVALEIM